MVKLWPLLLLITVQLVASRFTSHFRRFIVKHHGEEVAKRLERDDLRVSAVASTGGREEYEQTLKHRPIIFVHDLHYTLHYFEPYFRRLRGNGFRSFEMYGTTYGDGNSPFTTPEKSTDVEITCDFVKQIRQFIEIVNEYTKSKVDIVAHSLGSLLARMAVLGGKCPGSDYDIGKPLTDKVHNYISVAGVNYGASTCSWFSSDHPSCKGPISMRCDSEAVKKVNAPEKRYEGDNSFALLSWTDVIPIRRCCGHTCGKLKNANETLKYTFRTREGIIKASNNEVYQLLLH
ncbi:hypothetical protein AB6A40_000638 [Gnathostoma spinigerum]|uniref:Lipase n=1 Tax=Gnathostoma spinigerum TaxID=75299 RepID=A0ABD6E6Z3_9BILA